MLSIYLMDVIFLIKEGSHRIASHRIASSKQASKQTLNWLHLNQEKFGFNISLDRIVQSQPTEHKKIQSR
jgi:hypothetical protein